MRRRTFLSALGASTAAAAVGPVAASDGRFDGASVPADSARGAVDDHTIQQMLFGSTGGFLAPDMTPLTDDSQVAVFAEPTAEVRDRDGNGDAVSYPDDEPIPLVTVDDSGGGAVVGIGAQMVDDGGLVPELVEDDPLVDLGNEEFVLNCYDEFVDGDRILWDESHGQFYDLGSFQNFGSYAEDNGYTLAASSDLPADLPDADAVVITSPGDAFSEDELTALGEFVDSGGAVFFHHQSDFSNFDATATFNEVASALDLSFRFNDGEVGDTENNIGIGFLPLTGNFNDEAYGPLFEDRPGITVDIRRGETYEVDVVDVADGDTFDVLFSGSDVGLETDYEAEVRVLGVDTPESASVAAAAERPEEWEGLAYDVGEPDPVDELVFDSTASLLDADGEPLTDDSLVAVYAEPTASNVDEDGNGDAVSYPEDVDVPLVAVDGSVAGVGAPFVDGEGDELFDATADNEEFLLNLYDGIVDGDTVLWDEGHDQFYDLGSFGGFEEYAEGEGYDLQATTDLAADLPDADAVVVTSPSAPFSDAELDALAGFVADGGAVVLHDQSDFRDFDATANLNAIASALGLGFRFNDDQVLDPENNAGRSFLPTTGNFAGPDSLFETRNGIDDDPDARTTDYLVEWANRATGFAEDVLGSGDGEPPVTVRLSFDANEPLRDPTRLLAYAEYDSTGDGSYDTLYNRKLIEEGYARAYGSGLSRHDEFWAIENAARTEGRGVWAESDVSAASPYRDGPVSELFVPDAAAVRSADGALSADRVPVFAEDSATGGATPLAALDEDNRVALVGGPIIDESFEPTEGYPIDTSGYDNFAFLSAVIEYLTDREGNVLIDGGHGQFGTDYGLSSEDAAYYQRHLEGRGITLEQVNDPTLQKLTRGRAYVVTTPASGFTPGEAGALRLFADSGGAVVLVGAAAAPSAARANMTALAGELGTDLRFGDRVRDETNNLGGDPTVPTTTNLNPASPVVETPVDRADRDDDGEVDTGELRTAINDWAQGDYTTDQLREIIAAWARG